MRSTDLYLLATFAASSLQLGSSFVVQPSMFRGLQSSSTCDAAKRAGTLLSTSEEQIVSPFDDSDGSSVQEKSPIKLGDNLDLTWDNVEAVLDELRPFLIQDGGNVVITEIDGPVVKLELQVCQDCPVT